MKQRLWSRDNQHGWDDRAGKYGHKHKGWAKKTLQFLKMTSILKASLWTYTLSNLHETFTDLDPSAWPKSVKFSWRLLNVYVHSDAFSREVIFKNLRFFLDTL